ncbi:uncharacterized protein K460DRAFT_336896 [Cucurbitaria berberidis CBS 394.84]|uniref:Uncharacterized protein n=1 Tax=Cucurbitaria berberidis CBS 394.84 TaxID=1168544 RepID=A0A9P4GH00_9PLEO|nr:uncharacterized protein K460DRAFT_336896 [Cucurbitaria berberidis CBS 394.84]KAF1845066.1 hypothetical protein K460DRAFT_336896 [Cucurbitaria berberidis CBS 394.84]
MASYFDLPPQKAAAVANIDQVPAEERRELGGMSMLSPAVSRLLDDLGDEQSDSSSEEGSLSEDEDLADIEQSNKQPEARKNLRQDRQKLCPQTPPVPSSLSPRRSSPKSSANKGPKRVGLLPTSGGGGGPTKQKHPHMARFHSLRSMLFSANLEDKMSVVQQEEHDRSEAASNWKNQHDERKMHRPKTPEKETQANEGIGGRIKMRIRRVTSREAPTMERIGEDGAPVKFDDRASTASSDNDDEQRDMSWKYRDADEESIDHSDVEDLVRWVSRRDPPSDGEARREGPVPELNQESGHESVGQSDVDDLVRFASRRSDAIRESHVQTGYSDASTESDSELAKHSSDEEEDADDLVRWISHRDGPKAGPVRWNLDRSELDAPAEQHYDSDVPEIGGRFKRPHGTSGNSAATTTVHEFEHLDDEPERGRPRSRPESPMKEQKNHLRNNDIDELVRWVSRKDPESGDLRTLRSTQADVQEIKRDENEKKQRLGMTVDDGSLSHSDVQDLIEHAKLKSSQLPASDQPNNIGGSKEEVRKEQLGTKEDRTGSLGNEDVDELLRWVSGQRS